ncbi:MAG TPA: hypothetical protein PLD59_11265 [Tepidisphaeraceae bacterium]|nr:hypothetical protein [Tepidisphaeraceae bacterium]
MCVKNAGVEASLVVGKIYKVIRPEVNDGLQNIRVIDEEMEDYLYPSTFFVEIEVPARGRHALAQVEA